MVESKAVTEKYQVLESRFKVLNENHEELIKIKDEYKHECDLLRQLNKKYVAQLNENTREKELLDEQNVLNGKLQALNEKIREYEQHIGSLIEQYETRIKKAQTESELAKSKSEQEIKELSRKLDQFGKSSEELVKEFTEKLSKSEHLLTQHKVSIVNLERERDEQRLMNKKLVEVRFLFVTDKDEGFKHLTNKMI
jgi:chromosome segregation ATPase